MLRIGLTGGMGSGKSTVAKIFEVLEIPVYYADLAARRLMNEDPYLMQMIRGQFGEEAYLDGKLNRSFLASQVFTRKEKRLLLNSLVHPITIADSKQWMDIQVSPYAIKEAALIFESGTDKYLDFVIGISAPFNIRLSRILKRDGMSEDTARDRMNSQMDEDQKMSLCDWLIYNDEKQAVIPQVLALHDKLIELSKK
jgi:dephospho-CoA kinase